MGPLLIHTVPSTKTHADGCLHVLGGQRYPERRRDAAGGGWGGSGGGGRDSAREISELGCWGKGAGLTPLLAAFPAWLKPPPPLPAAPTPGSHYLTPGLLWQPCLPGPDSRWPQYSVSPFCTLRALLLELEWFGEGCTLCCCLFTMT